MPSSTSASDRNRPAARAIVVLLAGCLAIAAGAEGIVRLGFDRVSKIQRRTAEEHRAALAPRAGSARHTVLFVGNSLLDEGVEFDRLRARLAPEWDARRFVVEQTSSNDWYYGLRRLFEEGARPDLVVITLTPRQWFREDIRGDYSAHYLMTVPDAARAAAAMHMHPTQAASFMLASMSRFWGARAEIRNFTLGRILPELGDLMNYSSVADPTPMRDDMVNEVTGPKLARCRDLARGYGARVAALVPPVLEPQDGAGGLIRAGARAGVPVFAPVASGTYQAGFYRTGGFHLNPTGAREFTTVLANYLPDQLAMAAQPRNVVGVR